MKNYSKHVREIAELDLPWQRLHGRSILVAGATGLIGSCLVDVLMACNENKGLMCKVFALGRNESIAKQKFSGYIDNPFFEFVQHDLTLPLKGEFEYNFIVDAASYGDPHSFSEQPVDVMKANLLGVVNLLEYGKKHNVSRFLYVSSGEVYGKCDDEVLVEESCGYVDFMSSRSCYPSSKRAAETLCSCFAKQYGIDAVIARPCHIYGQTFTSTDNRVYAQFIRNVLNGEDIIMKSNGEQLRSWCYVVDCVSALLYILLKGETGEAYNIADTNSCISIKRLAEIIAEIGGRTIVLQKPSEDEKSMFNPMKASVFSVDKIRTLGWQTEGAIEEKLAQVICDLQGR